MGHPILLIASVVALQPAAPARMKPLALDGNWWLSISPDHRRGYLWTFTEIASNKRFGNRSPYRLEKYLTSHLMESSSDRNKSIALLLMRIHLPKPEHSSTTGQPFALDGRYWWECSIEERLGLVEGLLSGWSYFNIHHGKYSKDIQWYVSQISNWYGIKESDDHALDFAKAEHSIASVLAQFKDK